jgi:hypothetical protein
MTAPADPKRDVSNPVMTITIDRKAAGTASPAPIVIDVVANDDKTYYVRQRGLDRAVTVDKGRLDALVKLDRSKLVKAPPPKDAGTPAIPGAPKGAGMPPLPGMPGNAPTPPAPKAPTPAPKAATPPAPKAPTPPAPKTGSNGSQ